MNTTQLECFISVAHHLNFAKAAEELCITQPAVTHHIKALESELNVKLFNRSTRNVELTPPGLVFLDDARNIVAISSHAKDRFSDPSIAEMITLKIGGSGLAQLDLLSNILRKLTLKQPNLHPLFHHLSYSQIASNLENEYLDIALSLKDEHKKKSSLVYRELTKTAFCCVCKPDHPLAKRTTVTKADIKPYKLIIYNLTHIDYETVKLQNELSLGKSPADLYYCEFSEDAMVLTNAGIGISVLPEILTPPQYDLVTIPISDVRERSFGLYYKKYQSSNLLNDFIQIACEEFSH